MSNQAILDGGKINSDYRNLVVKKWSPMLTGLDGYKKFVTAVLYENQAEEMRKKGLLQESTTNAGGAIAPFTKYIFPILRRIWPNLIANEIVSIQPMTAPVGGLFFYELKYGTDKGKVKAGDVLVKNFNPYASAEFIDGELVGTGTGIVAIFTNTLKYLPVQPLEAAIVLDGTKVAILDADDNFINVDGGSAITEGANSKLNRTTGAITIEFAANPAADVLIECEYKYDSEMNKDVMEINMETTLEPVKAESRRFKAKWSAEASDDLRSLHGIDAEAELVGAIASEMALEVDREILSKLLQASLLQTANHAVFSAAVPSGEVEADHFKTLITKMGKVSNSIHKQTHRGAANWAVVSPDVATILEQLSAHADYRPITSIGGQAPAPVDPANKSYGIQKIGVVNNKYTVYKDPYFPAEKILMGYQGNSFLETGFIYAPYIPLEMTSTFQNPEDFSNSKGFRTRHAMKLVRGEHYGKIEVSDLP